MAIIKCKMCGGDMEMTADKTFGTCEFCGSTMTLPRLDDEQRTAAFNRGNHFRRIGEFDKALAVYERIVREDDTDAEAHWCCALCRFGIEYVEDPTTYEWLPTCHRASFDSFLEDVDYKAALEYSVGITRRQYMKDGAKIAEVQRGILATSQNAEPYDVFICYKESDEFGDRTRDSLLAQEIYYQLTEQGRKVFFSRITLEDVAGTQYEPYIFAALNSAKVMVVVGTKPEYLNSVWVKNEWSRFLAMMKKDRHKLLLPCYRDMDPYEMPEQLSVLQSYDMSKIGFIQDLTRGISKVLAAEKKPAPVKETVVVQQSAAPAANIAPLLKRAFIFLEDGEWERADDFCEQVLNMDPECALAYVGKLMVELRVQNQSDLYNQEQPFDTHNNFKKAFRFGDDKMREMLTGYIRHINDRNENARLEGIYRNACYQMETANNEQAFLAAAQEFETIRSFKDAAALVKQCRENAEAARLDNLYTVAKSLMVGTHIPSYQDAIKQFEALNGWRDSLEMIAACRQRIEEIEAANERARLEKLYQEANSALAKASSEGQFKAAAKLFAAIEEYKDAADMEKRCFEKAEAARKDVLYATAKNLMTGNKISSYQEAIRQFEVLDGWRDSAAQIALCHKRIKEIETQIELQRQERIRQEALKERQRLEKLYRDATRELERANSEERYKEVAKLFATIGGYKDSAQLAQQCLEDAESARKNALYASAKKKMGTNRIPHIEEAIRRFEELGDWKDSPELIEVCRQRIEELQRNGTQAQPAHRSKKKGLLLTAASVALVVVLAAVALALPITRYHIAVKLMDTGNYEKAISVFETLDDYEDSAALLRETQYLRAIELMDARQYDDATEAFAALNGYKDSAVLVLESRYLRANGLMDAGQYEEAIETFEVVNDYKDSAHKALTLQLSRVDEGGYITFGAYEQDNDLTNGKEPIEWLVLKKEEGRTLLISKYVLDSHKYSDFNDPWSDSSLRSWLNGEFLNAAFSESARTMIPKMLVHPHGHLTLQTNQGNATWDHVFVLSVQEVDEYFDSESARQCQPTAYAVVKGANDSGNASWLLRTRANTETSSSSEASFEVTLDGTIGTCSIRTGSGVRPALWIQPDLFVPSADPEVPNHEPEAPTEVIKATEPLNEAVLAENYNRGLEQLKAGNTLEALRYFSKAEDYKDAKAQAAELRKLHQTIMKPSFISTHAPSGSTPGGLSSSSSIHGRLSSDCYVALRTDGTVVAVGRNCLGADEVSDWKDIVSVETSVYHTLGVKSDGSVVATGNNDYGQCDVEGWTDIIATSAGRYHTAGLKADGTVVATGNNHNHQCDVSDWTDIIDISVGTYYTAGLKADGTVIVTGNEYSKGVSGWTDIVAISAGRENLVGLKADGTVVATDHNGNPLHDVNNWTDIVAISAGTHVVGLKADGTVVAVDINYEISGWTDIVAIDAGSFYTIGLKADGTLMIPGSLSDNNLDSGLRWNNIKTPDIKLRDNYINYAAGSLNALSEVHYKQALEQLAQGNTLAALKSFTKAGNYQDAKARAAELRKSCQKQPTFSTGLGNNPMESGVSLYAVALKENGAVITAGYNLYGQRNVSNWKDIIAVDTSNVHTVGLKSDGTVVAIGMNDDGECNVSDWTDIVAISVGAHHTLGLKADGTVVATGNNKYRQCNVGTWKDIIAVSAGGEHSVGLKADGTVVAVGRDNGQLNVSGWNDIIAIDAGRHHTVGLKADGTVVAYGSRSGGASDVSDWTDIIAISAGENYTVGLKADGTVIATGRNNVVEPDVSGWTDIVAISAGAYQTIGLKKDGTMVSTTVNNEFKRYINAPFNISGWRDIKLPERPKLLNHDNTISIGSGVMPMPYGFDVCAVAVRENGTVAATGSNRFGQCKVSAWKDIISVETSGFHTVGLKADGTVVAVGYNEFGQCDVSEWENIVSIIAGYDHTVGLKKDGTVVAVGNNEDGQCDVSDWTNIAAIAEGEYYTAGLKTDGTVVATDQVIERDWTGIVAISGSRTHLVGLKSDGTLVSTRAACIDSNWTDIVAVSAGKDYTIALKEDGTVVAAGNNDSGQCDVSDWTDIIAISASTYQTMGLKSDGTVVLSVDADDHKGSAKAYTSSCNVSGWKDVKIPG